MNSYKRLTKRLQGKTVDHPPNFHILRAATPRLARSDGSSRLGLHLVRQGL